MRSRLFVFFFLLAVSGIVPSSLSSARNVRLARVRVCALWEHETKFTMSEVISISIIKMSNNMIRSHSAIAQN